MTSEQGDLPKGWAWSTVGEACERVEKVDPRRDPGQRFEYIDIGGVDGGSGRIVETKSLLGEEAPSRARQLVRAGDTVLSTVRTYQRKTAAVAEHLDGAIASTGFAVLRPRPGISPLFLFHQVRGSDFVDALNEQQTGTSYPAVRERDVRAMPIRLAPDAEQERIVAAFEEHLSHLDAAESTVRTAAVRLCQMDASLVKAALDGDWPTQPLGNHTVDQRYGTSAKTGGRGEVAVLRMGNIQNGGLDWTELKYLPADHQDFPACLLEPGDLLFNRTNSGELVGKTAIFTGADRPTSFASYLIRVRLDDELLPEWAALVINSAQGRRYIDEVRTQNVGQSNVNGTKLKAFPVSVPPISAQRARVTEVERQRLGLRRLRNDLDAASSTAEALRHSILAAGFSGQLVAQDPADASADALLAQVAAERPPATSRRKRVRA